MNKILNPKILAIVQVIIAGATLLDVFLGFDLVSAPRYIAAVIGLTGAIFLLKGKIKEGFIFSTIWAILQIPIFISGDADGDVITFNAHQGNPFL